MFANLQRVPRGSPSEAAVRIILIRRSQDPFQVGAREKSIVDLRKGPWSDVVIKTLLLSLFVCLFHIGTALRLSPLGFQDSGHSF